MHSKLMIVDDDIVNIGSANMDRRSFNLNFEINSIIYDKEFNKRNRKIVEEEIRNSVLLSNEKRIGLVSKCLERIVRLFAPII